MSSQQYLQNFIWHHYPSISMDQQEFTDQISRIFLLSTRQSVVRIKGKKQNPRDEYFKNIQI